MGDVCKRTMCNTIDTVMEIESILVGWGTLVGNWGTGAAVREGCDEVIIRAVV